MNFLENSAIFMASRRNLKENFEVLQVQVDDYEVELEPVADVFEPVLIEEIPEEGEGPFEKADIAAEEGDSKDTYFRNLVMSEQKAIKEYELALSNYDLTPDERDTLLEILGDEQDHVIKITMLLETVLQDMYPNKGDE